MRHEPGEERDEEHADLGIEQVSEQPRRITAPRRRREAAGVSPRERSDLIPRYMESLVGGPNDPQP